MFSCDVEQDARYNKACHLRQDDTDDFDWTCKTGRTPAGMFRYRRLKGRRYPRTGPSSAMSGVNYLYTSGKKNHVVARQERIHASVTTCLACLSQHLAIIM